MEIIRRESEFGIPEYTVLRLRPDSDDFDYSIYPEKTVEKTVELLTKSGISFDLVRGDSEYFGMIPLKPSAFDNDELKQNDAVALQCSIDRTDLDEAVRYINEHGDVEKIEIMKRSELPEFLDPLDEEIAACYPEEIREVLCIYMRSLLDMTDGDRMRAMMMFDEKLQFGKLLGLYSKDVREFILDHTSKRYAEELKKEMSPDGDNPL